MSEIVDQVLDSVTSSEPSEVTISEFSPVESEAAEDPVASEATEAPVEEVAPVEESVPVTTEEVVQNVQEILSSTGTNVSVDNSELENRVKVLEERLDKMYNAMPLIIREVASYPHIAENLLELLN